MKKKRSGKKGSCNAGAERFPQTEALNHEHEKLKERARYDALIADHQKSCDVMIRKYKELAERGTTGQDTNV